MTVESLIHELQRRGITLRVDGDRLVCNAPKGALTPALAGRIRDSKEALRALIREAGSAESGGIQRVARGGPVPLGFVQQRMWLHAVMEPDTVLYNLPAAWRLRGRLDRDAFTRALQAFVDRHEILRCRIDATGPEPVQHLGDPLEVVLPFEDLSALPRDERERALKRRLEQARDFRFDFARGHLFHHLLVRLGDEEHAFFFMPQHCVWDGWSFDIFLSELSELYAAEREGRPPRLAELEIQYVDYAAWHRQTLLGGEIERQMRFWREHLSGDLPLLEIPADRPRASVFSFSGDWEEFEFGGPFVEAIGLLAKERRATPFMVVLAAWYAFLHRHTGQEEIVVGVPIQARQRPEVGGLIGAFVNTLAFRVRVSWDEPFADLIDRLRLLCIEGYEHQEAPIELLIDELVRQRTLDRTPLFQTMFSHQQVSRRPRGIGDLVLEQIHVNPAAASTDLMLAMMEGSEGARGIIHYSTDVFDAAAVRVFRRRFETLLGGVLENPSALIGDLPMQDTEERLQLESWNDTIAPLDEGATVHGLIEAQVDRTPGAIAAVFEDRSLTYRDLDERANAVAARLRERGVGPGTLVGVAVPRSTELLVAALGVLKAGGAYVPMDPAFPMERLRFMIEDAKATVLLTQEGALGSLEAPGVATMLVDDAQLPPRSERVSAGAGGRDLAYVIFTSGSTGRPKGVQIEHRSVVNFLRSMARAPGIAPQDVLLAVTTLSFDIAALELFLPLVAGARVVIAPQDAVGDGWALKERIERHGVTLMQATPVSWRLLLDAGFTGRTDFRVLCGGEALPEDLAARLVGLGGPVWNMYGPTETTVWSTCGDISAERGRIPIGRPIANTTCYVVDDRLRPVPAGVAGELLIGGAGVARGYLDRPELTAEKFVADPVRPGERVYRTGDMARFRADGQLECLGRVDHQVKLRGFRIELGEIETVLQSHPSMRSVVVIAREDEPGDKRLVAYVVPVDAQPPIGELRKLCRRALPEYMMPSAFVSLDALPLTPNGKIDRKGLPRPEAPIEQAADFVGPRTPTEELVAKSWCQILQVGRAGVHDNFFDLGGHSLLALRVVASLERETGYRLSPRELIFQTLDQIAASIDKNRLFAAGRVSGVP